MTLYELRKLLDNIIDPSNNQTLKENNAIKHIAYDAESGIVTMIVTMVTKEPDTEKALRRIENM